MKLPEFKAGGSARPNKREKGLPENCLTPPSFVLSHLREELLLFRVRTKVVNFLSVRGVPYERRATYSRRTRYRPGLRKTTKWRRRRSTPSSSSAGPHRRHFQQRWGPPPGRARVFNKPVKARPRICLPSAFVTLLVLWLEPAEPTWKKGVRDGTRANSPCVSRINTTRVSIGGCTFYRMVGNAEVENRQLSVMNLNLSFRS